MPNQEINPCVASECFRSATCIPTGSTYVCACSPGYDGTYCNNTYGNTKK